MKEKKNLALVFGITGNYVFALANTLMGLVNNNKKFWDDIIIYYDEISESDIKDINKIVECKFICASDLKFAKKLPKELLKEYSIATFYRYECFNLLNEYHKVIWNDVDILILNDISGLCNYGDKSGFCLTLNTGGFNVEANFKKLIPEYNMYTLLYNAGIMVLSDKINDYKKSYDWLIDTTNKYADILRWGDQGILNLFIQEFKIDVENIDIEKYCCHPSLYDNKKDIAIVHAYGADKFWNSISYQEKFPSWVQNDVKWKSISANKTNNKPLVSCIMSIYDRFDYAQEAIQSILNQTYDNIELIIVIEKSDNQDYIEKQLLKIKDKRIVLVKNNKKLGFPASLNVAIKMAKGKYIARMDDDDISLPERFEKQVEFMEANPNIGISGTNAVFFGKYNTEIGAECDPETLKIITLFRTPFVHPTVIMNKKMLLDNNLFYSTDYFCEDYELWSRAVSCFDIANIPDVLLKYRTGNEKLTSSFNDTKIHTCHKQIVGNQLKKYLDLEFTDNEIELMQERKSVFNVCFNYNETIKFKDKTYLKIINANKTNKFYDEDKLEKYIKNKASQDLRLSKPNIFKRAIKKVLRPFYTRLMEKIENYVNEKNNQIYNYVDKKFEELSKK